MKAGNISAFCNKKFDYVSISLRCCVAEGRPAILVFHVKLGPIDDEEFYRVYVLIPDCIVKGRIVLLWIEINISTFGD